SDHLGRRQTLPASRSLRFGADSPLRSTMTRGFEYSDCWVDDARLVVLNAMAAREQGAHVHTRTRCVSAQRRHGLWHLHLERADGSRLSIRSRALVNACGPWVSRFIEDELKHRSHLLIRLVQCRHNVVPHLYEGPQTYNLQNVALRVVFDNH